jgi:hypothetical protein
MPRELGECHRLKAVEQRKRVHRIVRLLLDPSNLRVILTKSNPIKKYYDLRAEHFFVTLRNTPSKKPPK